MSTLKSINETIGERLKMIREKSGLSTNKFAEVLEMSQPAWSRLENEQAEPRTRTIVALIEKFGTDPLWLLTGKTSHVIQTPTALKIGQLADTLPEAVQTIMLFVMQREAMLESLLEEKSRYPVADIAAEKTPEEFK